MNPHKANPNVVLMGRIMLALWMAKRAHVAKLPGLKKNPRRTR